MSNSKPFRKVVIGLSVCSLHHAEYPALHQVEIAVGPPSEALRTFVGILAHDAARETPNCGIVVALGPARTAAAKQA